MSRALSEDLRRLDWKLLPGRCNVGTFGCGQETDEGEIPLAVGDMGCANGEGDKAETDEGEPGKRLKAAAMSITLGPDADDARGEGTADPVETYKGRSSSVLCAKKHTLLLQLVPSLQSRVRY